MVVYGETSLDEIMKSYQIQFPKESSIYLAYVKKHTDELAKPTGMSSGGRMMRLTAIPEFVMWCMRAKQREYWSEKKNIYSFIRSYPKFMIGDHTLKHSKGTIIK